MGNTYFYISDFLSLNIYFIGAFKSIGIFSFLGTIVQKIVHWKSVVQSIQLIIGYLSRR